MQLITSINFETFSVNAGSPLTGARATNLWYDENKKFDWKNESFTPETERFTQMVWKNTTRVGFGRSQFTERSKLSKLISLSTDFFGSVLEKEHNLKLKTMPFFERERNGHLPNLTLVQ